MHVQEPHTEVEKLVQVLASMPLEQQAALATQYRQEAEHIRDLDARLDAMTEAETERLRAMIQQGMDSGIAGELDVEAVKRRGHQRLKAEGKL